MNRRWTIRARILTLLLAPMIPLLAMLVFATSVAVTPALNLRNARISVDAAGLPAAEVVTDLQNERLYSVIVVSESVPNQDNISSLIDARNQTDAATKQLTTLSSNKTFRNAANAKTLIFIDQLRTELLKLPAERTSIDQGIARTAVMTFYNGLVQITFNLYGSIASLDDHALQRQADGVVGMAQASEFLAREGALVAGPQWSRSETSMDYQQLVATISTKRFLYDQAAQYLSPADSAFYQQIISGSAYIGLTKIENQLIAKETLGVTPAINNAQWKTDFTQVTTALGGFEGVLALRVINATGNAATDQEDRLAIAVGAGILMLLILLFFSLRVARNIIRRVTGLRVDALSLALDRLPSVVSRLRRGETVDLRAETPPLKYGSDELGQLGDAFTRVQETAITSAVQEANLRHGFNQVFLNIARRSQTLLHRQLALLDTMERTTEDPDQLEELFRIDHLATRMRRHAEDLVILAGSTPGRGWRNPIPFADVLRAAASEVEEYARISVVGVPDVGVAGRAVSDVVHLLAELLENATMFSPPETQVLLSGQAVPNGFVIEIEDRGLGMSLVAIDEANARLASPPDFDPANSSRLGLFVVTRLAARHGISVTLRRSPYGGVSAVTLIPAELVVPLSEISLGSHSAAIGARLPAPRVPVEEDTAERPISSTAAVAVLDDAMSEATMMLTLDGLPKRSRKSNAPRQLPESPGLTTFGAHSGSNPLGVNAGTGTPRTGATSSGGATGRHGVESNRDQRNSTPSMGQSTGAPSNAAPSIAAPSNTAPSNTAPSNAASSNAAPPNTPPNGMPPNGTPTNRTPEVGVQRTPEQMRSMLSSFQDGMVLGRRDAANVPRYEETTDAATPVSGSHSAETTEERQHPHE
jgi:anti-sigma regulatory factor (Ser/Thr protein kinase)